MSGRRNGTGDYDFSGLPPRDYFNRPSSSRRPSRRDGYGGDPLPQPELSRRTSRRDGPSRYPPVSMYNSDMDYGRTRRSRAPSPEESRGWPSSERVPRRRESFGDYDEPPPIARRGGMDYSNNAADFYDPFAGALRRPSEFNRPSLQGDPELPSYRSASAYAREQLPPSYRTQNLHRFDDHPPPYRSFSSQGGYGGPAPMQYPPTRPSGWERPPSRQSSMSRYGRASTSSGGRSVYEVEPPPGYYMRKWDR